MKYAEYVNRLFAKSAKRGIPLSGTFELTARCNLRCRMCYIHREENDGEIKTDEFSSEEWLNIAKEAQLLFGPILKKSIADAVNSALSFR